MKSCRCAQCNVSSARHAWGFALLARDGWAVADGSRSQRLAGGSLALPSVHETEQPSLAWLGEIHHAAATPSRALRARGFLRVLLVDDEDMVRRCTGTHAERVRGHRRQAAAHDALAILAADSDFDAVLSDVVMPRMSGPELFARCYHDYPKLAQRFVFASGNPESARGELMRVVQELGASQPPILLSKPCPREGLLLALFAAAAHARAPFRDFLGRRGDATRGHEVLGLSTTVWRSATPRRRRREADALLASVSKNPCYFRALKQRRATKPKPRRTCCMLAESCPSSSRTTSGGSITTLARSARMATRKE